MKRSLTDQPEILEGAEVLVDFFAKQVGARFEVRKTDGAFFLTTGNLFGSQTVKAPDAESVLRVIGLAMNRDEGSEAPVALPDECEIMGAAA